MATDEDERRYTMENPHPADEDLSPKLKEYIYGNPDELPELPDPPENERNPFIHGERIGSEDDESSRQKEESSVATEEGEHHPAVEEFINGDPDELPELGEPVGDDWDPLLDGERICIGDDE